MATGGKQRVHASSLMINACSPAASPELHSPTRRCCCTTASLPALLREMGFVCTMHPSGQCTPLPLKKKHTHTDKETNCAYKHYGAIQFLTDSNAHLAKTTGFPLSGFWSKTNRLHWRETQKPLVSLILSCCWAPLLFFSFFFFCCPFSALRAKHNNLAQACLKGHSSPKNLLNGHQAPSKRMYPYLR